MYSSLLFSLLIFALITAAVTDVCWGRIPNWITFPLAVISLGAHTWTGGWDGFLFSLQGCLMGLVCLIWFYARGGMGAGDVKLMGATGAVLGATHVVYAFAVAALLGGLYSLTIMVAQGGLRSMWERLVVLVSTMFVTRSAPQGNGPQSKTEPKLRYALVIGLGTLISQTMFWYGWW